MIVINHVSLPLCLNSFWGVLLHICHPSLSSLDSKSIPSGMWWHTQFFGAPQKSNPTSFCLRKCSLQNLCTWQPVPMDPKDLWCLKVIFPFKHRIFWASICVHVNVLRVSIYLNPTKIHVMVMPPPKRKSKSHEVLMILPRVHISKRSFTVFIGAEWRMEYRNYLMCLSALKWVYLRFIAYSQRHPSSTIIGFKNIHSNLPNHRIPICKVVEDYWGL